MGPSQTTNGNTIWLLLLIVLLLTIGFAFAEYWISNWSYSLALQSDARHLFTDISTIILALVASWLSRLLLLYQSKYYDRFKIISALINALGLLLISVLIFWEAWKHLQSLNQIILSTPMFLTALLGLLVNGLAISILHEQSQQDLNIRGVFIHVLADLASSVGIILGLIAIGIFHCNWLDSFIGMGISLLLASSGVSLIFQGLRQWSRSSPQKLQKLGLLEVGTTKLINVIGVESSRDDREQ
ncbi:MAG: cation diffusion facilitator family transporter [Trichodesmium sp. MAG_R04]|nr:cation diffusion facilitator family transporter [Trichodesmium sp. MAG_R04]